MIQIVIVLYVSGAPRSGGDAPGDVETKEVEEANGEHDGDGRSKVAWVRDGLVPSTGERAVIDRKSGVRIRLESVPKPSHPTATSGVTEYVDRFLLDDELRHP